MPVWCDINVMLKSHTYKIYVYDICTKLYI